MDYEAYIEKSVKAQQPFYKLSNDVFILGPTASFSGWEQESFELICDVAKFFAVSGRSVHFCGSAKIGFSPIKLHEFKIGESDLDIAILDSDCFRRYHEIVLMETKQLSLRNRFPPFFDKGSGQRKPGYDVFVSYISKGIFRPDLMPNMPEKIEWLSFFRELTKRYRGRYKNVSAAIYLSDVAFNLKQAHSLHSFAESRGFL